MSFELPKPSENLPDPVCRAAPAGFTWIPFFAELTDRVLSYRHRQSELISFLQDLKQQGRMIGVVQDQDSNGTPVPLEVHDPFTFFSHFCRAITWANKKALFSDLKALWHLTAEIPNDLQGIPEVNNQKAAYFAFAPQRGSGDIEALWNIAEQAVEGIGAVTEQAWSDALRVKQVALAKLTMGLFWLNPTAFLPLDQNVRSYLLQAGIALPQAPTLAQYLQVVQEAQKRLGMSCPEISYAAFQAISGSIPQPRYWAGGHYWSTGSRLKEFVDQAAWWHGYPKTDTRPEAQQAFERFAQIQPGDYFAIKGWGGRNDLRVYLAGKVENIDPTQQRLTLTPLPAPNPDTIKPAPGSGSWSGTLREVTDPVIIAWMFQQKPYTPSFQEPTTTMLPLNTILYGPPGTGKTYETAQRAVAIIDGAVPPGRKDLMARYKQLQREGRIGFVTFHQSYSYEDFVEGIRPVMDKEDSEESPQYRIVDGILKNLAINALGAALDTPPAEQDPHTSFATVWAMLEEQVIEHPQRTYKGLTDATEFRIEISATGGISGQNIKNPAMTSLLHTSRQRLETVWNTYEATEEKISSAQVQKVFVSNGHHFFTAALYNELKRIAKTLPPETPVIAPSARQKSQDFLQRGEESRYTLQADSPRYVLIVDEINRGNISKILGELITLLEDDKRIGEDNELTVTLPYSRESFALPPNLYLIGTMNTADKSLALLDVALRRRFTFTELPPRFEVCGLDPTMQEAVEQLNRRITLRKDRDHRIGHAFFMKVGSDTDAFDRAFTGKVIPLLQEYFFNDWDGLRYVLGEKTENGGFIRPIPEADKSARNRWQWYTDAGVTLSPLQQLITNYATTSKNDNNPPA